MGGVIVVPPVCVDQIDDGEDVGKAVSECDGIEKVYIARAFFFFWLL